MQSNNYLSHISKELKLHFYDLLTSGKNRSYHELLIEVARVLEDVLTAQYVGVYVYNASEGQFFLHSSNAKLTQQKLDYQDWISFQHGHSDIGHKVMDGRAFFNKENSYIIPLYDAQEVIGFVYIVHPSENYEEIVQSTLHLIVDEVAKVVWNIKRNYQTLGNEKKYKQLFEVTAKFHSSMNMEEILMGIMDTLREVYSQYEYYLLLSHDYSSTQHLPIKELNFDNNEIESASAKAYLTGEIQFEDIDEQCSCFYAPLKGKQGVYGVLQIVSAVDMFFNEEDVEFIKLLSNTAGNALENARLYQQSKRLISDLQLINETSHKLNSNLRLTETIAFMANQIKTSFHAEEIGFILYKDYPNRNQDVLSGSTAHFYEVDSDALKEFVRHKVSTTHDSLFIGDISTKITSKYCSVMAIPMIQNGSLNGVVIVLHTEPYYFSFETFKLLQSLVHHSTLAFANSMLREELEQLVRTDYLTKLCSRKYLDETIHKHIEEHNDGSFLIIDIDDFKKVNDCFGHQVGDRILVQVATIVKEHIGFKGIVARWGGEELAIYLPHTSLLEGYVIGRELVEKVNQHTNPNVTISCGVSYWDPTLHTEVKDFFIRADRALYEAKDAGKNAIRRDEVSNV
ncbi:diguanylate cyclase domain-containing protein [Pontibacillus yanchengensis]|uniref:Diguanylate cyclase n=1 Tax=Pontibacillus yanchengensis Y32 TaxID=1385514 RepID=A0A0A2TGU0_9BACI|nr:diguanylate cyclase [Pontibacillus yanchengensis]KGP73653.1 diguanylate cyclase [Pontibacillus yanchengensis Y32]